MLLFVIDDSVSFPLLFRVLSSEFTVVVWCFGSVSLSSAVSSYDEFLKIERKPGIGLCLMQTQLRSAVLQMV